LSNFFSSIFRSCRREKEEETDTSPVNYLSEISKLEEETKEREKNRKKKKNSEEKKKKIKKTVEVNSDEIEAKNKKKSKKSSKKKEEPKEEKIKKTVVNKTKNKTIPSIEDSFFGSAEDHNYTPFQNKKLYLDQEIHLKERNKYNSGFTDYSYIIDKYIVNPYEKIDHNHLQSKEISVMLKNKMEEYIKNNKK
ncbi:hypothetical protein H311_04246, partial [Anncaliia algerae PRA109]